KQGNNQLNDSSSTMKDNSSINVIIPTKRASITNDIFPPTPSSSKSTLQFASLGTIPNLIPSDAILDSIDRKRESLLREATTPTRQLNIQQDSIFLDNTDASSINSIKTDQETDLMQIITEPIDETAIPAIYPSSSRQEDEKYEKLQEFREIYSLKPKNINVNKRKRCESHYSADGLFKTSGIHPIYRHSSPIETDKLKKIMLYLKRYHMIAIRGAKERSRTIRSQLNSNINRYDILLRIDPIILSEFDPTLGYRLLNDFVSTYLNEDFTEACLFTLQSTFGPDEILMAEQVRSKIRLEYLPDIPEYRMDKYSTAFYKTRHSKDPFFATIRGIIECVWIPTFVIFSHTFCCYNSECRNKSYLHVVPNARTNRVIKRTEDKEYLNTSTSATLHDIDLYCSHCEQEMKEMTADRVYTIRQRIRLSCVNENENDGSFTNSILAFVEDELVNNIEIGQIIDVIGLFGRHFPTLNDGIYCTNSWYDNGLHIENKIRISERSFDENHSCVLPDVIVSLQKANLSAWAFTQRLIDVFCDDIAPRPTCRKIKLFLLLSLMALSEQNSKKQGNSPSVHFMILSNGFNPIVPRIMRRASELKRHEEWTHGLDKEKQSLFVLQDEQHTGKESDGILLVNLDTLDRHGTESLKLVMSKSSKLSVQNLRVHLDTCCWGWSVAKPTFGNQTGSSENEGIDRICNDAIKSIIDTFHLVIYLNESIDSEENIFLVDHLLEQEAIYLEEKEHKKKLTVLAFEEFKQFIAVASSIEVRYFLMCRKLEGASQGFTSSTAFFESLLKIARCHAKLCLRYVGSVDDALVSILAIEETLVAKYGSSASVLGFAPLSDDQENIHKLYTIDHRSVDQEMMNNDVANEVNWD
ncbi:16185_t:CDS:10, partial [Funneliformis mosseae]